MAVVSIKNKLKSGSLLVGNAAYIPGDFYSIATTTVGSGGASYVEFTSIPSDYTHLQIRFIARTTHSGPADCYMRYNGDTGNNYTGHYLRGDGASVSGGHIGTSVSVVPAGKLSYNTTSPYNNAFTAVIIDILDYKDTNKYKTSRVLSGFDTNGDGTYKGFLDLMSGVWMSTSAITSIRLFSGDSANFPQYSSFALYGIKG